MFRLFWDHCEGPSSTCKEKCIEIQYCMYRQVTDACKKKHQSFVFTPIFEHLFASKPVLINAQSFFRLTLFEWFISIYFSNLLQGHHFRFTFCDVSPLLQEHT